MGTCFSVVKIAPKYHVLFFLQYCNVWTIYNFYVKTVHYNRKVWCYTSKLYIVNGLFPYAEVAPSVQGGTWGDDLQSEPLPPPPKRGCDISKWYILMQLRKSTSAMISANFMALSCNINIWMVTDPPFSSIRTFCSGLRNPMVRKIYSILTFWTPRTCHIVLATATTILWKEIQQNSYIQSKCLEIVRPWIKSLYINTVN